MIRFEPCKPEHIGLIEVQAAQLSEARFNHGISDELVRQSFALSAWDGERCIAAGGARQVWEGRGVAWAFLSAGLGPAMVPIARQLRASLDMLPFKRIEMMVRADFTNGVRLALMLGFVCETPDAMRSFLPDGSDAFLFARVKP